MNPLNELQKILLAYLEGSYSKETVVSMTADILHEQLLLSDEQLMQINNKLEV